MSYASRLFQDIKRFHKRLYHHVMHKVYTSLSQTDGVTNGSYVVLKHKDKFLAIESKFYVEKYL